jgi:hypothetical protein
LAGDCGSCTACCRVYAIPSLDKPAGKWCDHCAIGTGCKIYETRPELCIDFKCLWLQSRSREDRREHLPDELRPDRCKVVFSPTTNEEIMSAMVMPGQPDAFRKGAARRLIETMVKGGMRVVAGLPQATTKVMIDENGEREVEMTEPDENGMQWSIET